MLEKEIRKVLERQRKYFATGITRSYAFRRRELKKLKKAVKEKETELMKALAGDLGKSVPEAYTSEVSFVLREIDFVLKHLKKWMKPRRAAIPLICFPSSGRIHPEPYGVSLIMGPWNYPFQLVASPLVGAIAAGDCAIIKPSELAKNISHFLARLIGETFSPEYISVVEGGVEEGSHLLAQDFDLIFYTGSSRVGRIVMEAAAKHLTPVVLELGGKSPCVVDETVDTVVAAKRITWGKFLNAGQTCVAPDYLLVHKKVKPALTEAIKKALHQFYGENPHDSVDYPRIINERHVERLSALLGEGDIITGGEVIKEERFIAPTVIDNVQWTDKIMADEIFGPILPVLEYETVEDAISQINAHSKPLALYVFSKNKKFQDRIISETSSGGVCVNDTVLHIIPFSLPFGGVGESGMGSYHGKAGFDAFSHFRSVLRKSFVLDSNLRYPPYRPLTGVSKKLFDLFG